MKRKRFLAAAVAAAMLLGLAGCSSSSNSSGNGGTQEQTNTEDSGDTIKIGYVSALSGDTALWGQAGLNGMNLTVKDINEAGGVLGKQRTC